SRSSSASRTGRGRRDWAGVCRLRNGWFDFWTSDLSQEGIAMLVALSFLAGFSQPRPKPHGMLILRIVAGRCFTLQCEIARRFLPPGFHFLRKVSFHSA